MKNLTDFCKTVKPVWGPRLEINRVVKQQPWTAALHLLKFISTI